MNRVFPRTRPSWCADPCLEMVKSLPYLDFVSECFHFFLTKVPQSRAKLMPREQRLVFSLQSEAEKA